MKSQSLREQEVKVERYLAKHIVNAIIATAITMEIIILIIFLFLLDLGFRYTLLTKIAAIV